MKFIHFDPRHALVVYKEDGMIGLAHHGQVLLEIECNHDEIQIFKRLYNKIVENHHSLNIRYRKNELLKTHLKKYPIMRPKKIIEKIEKFSFQKYIEDKNIYENKGELNGQYT